MADVVQEACGLDELSLVVRELERPRHLPRDMAHAEAVLDARVVRPREDEVREAELADRVETLELERLEQVERQRFEANGPVHGVGNRLQFRHRPCDVQERIKSFVPTV